jgi:23S rRNA (cytidine1920-2'-O)/16S rRNA (cytidine1409-2'-O)-methyltransferase
VQQGLAESREKAKVLIMAGQVMVDERKIEKPGQLIPLNALVSIKGPSQPYVSRGGLKLEAALDHFSIRVENKIIMDVGASTGGFTDCLLKRGAKRVIAVDVGYGQLDWKIRQDPRVRVMERTNIRYLQPEVLEERVQGAVIDVSFISLKIVIPPVSGLLTAEAFIVALIKPQFEVGRGKVGKGGVVRDPGLHNKVISDLEDFFLEQGWQIIGHITSPILGPKGNKEFLIYLKR